MASSYCFIQILGMVNGPKNGPISDPGRITILILIDRLRSTMYCLLSESLGEWAEPLVNRVLFKLEPELYIFQVLGNQVLLTILIFG
jgi:hypothetical protein